MTRHLPGLTVEDQTRVADDARRRDFPTRCGRCACRIFTGNTSGLCADCHGAVDGDEGRWTSWKERDAGQIVVTIEPGLRDPEDGCTCDRSPGAHTPGSHESVALGETDPDCPHHGKEL